MSEAKQMIAIVGEIPRDSIQDDSDSSLSSTFGYYKSVIEELLLQFQ